MSLNHTITRLCARNKDGSYATQADRLKSLKAMGRQLRDLGYKLQDVSNLKPKHITRLVESWRAQGLATGTMHNRMSHLRWAAEKIGKEGIVPTNKELGIDRRTLDYRDNAQARAAGFMQGDRNAIADPYIRTSADLQAAFGLRREEAMKIQPHWADRGNHIMLKGSWTKGGKQRLVPIVTREQRLVLEQAKTLTSRSMIPAHKSYAEHVKTFEREMQRAGFDGSHGARYLYAHERYETLTGMAAPGRGGPGRSEMSDHQRDIADSARVVISRELGHERVQITARYLGG